MGEIRPMPRLGDVFVDVRGNDRTMRVSYHAEQGVIVVSLWLGLLCRGSFRMSADDAGRLISTLSDMRAAGVPFAMAGADAGVSAPGTDLESAPAATAGMGTPDPSTPSPEQTGEINRIADASTPPFTLRVA